VRVQGLVESYGASRVRIATLCTPTDAYLISDAAAAAARANLAAAPLWQKALQAHRPLGLSKPTCPDQSC
jgi:hypothetical protein